MFVPGRELVEDQEFEAKVPGGLCLEQAFRISSEKKQEEEGGPGENSLTSVLTRAGRYFFSVETPTKKKYSFTNDADASPRSALSGLTLWIFDHGFKKQANVEFKAGNPPVYHIRKDIEKLIGEGATQRVGGNWFHLLKNVDSGTLPRLFVRFIPSRNPG